MVFNNQNSNIPWPIINDSGCQDRPDGRGATGCTNTDVSVLRGNDKNYSILVFPFFSSPVHAVAVLLCSSPVREM